MTNMSRQRGNSLDVRLQLYMSLMGPYMALLFLGALPSAVSFTSSGYSPSILPSLGRVDQIWVASTKLQVAYMGAYGYVLGAINITTPSHTPPSTAIHAVP